MIEVEEKNVLGIKIRGHDPGAALIADGKIVAISEERLNRNKHSTDIFPHLSIKYCLEALDIKPEDVDLIVMDSIDMYDENKIKALFFEKENRFSFSAEIQVINHHLAHAASAFLCSPFNEAAIMVVDGTGSRIKTHYGDAWETETLYSGFGNEINQIQKTFHPRSNRIFADTCGIGLLYTFITRRYLNFGRYNEGKTMGLAAYGNAQNIFKNHPKKLWLKELNGHFVCNPKIQFPGFSRLFLIFKHPLKALKQMRVRIFLMIRNVLWEKPTFHPIRLSLSSCPKNQPLPHRYYSDIAAVVQDIIEDVFLGLSHRLNKITRSDNLCIAGGCGLNGISNQKILQDKKFKEIFIQPASSDAGIPLGCALWGYNIHFKQPRDYVMRHAYLGKEYSEKDIQNTLEKTEGVTFRKSDMVADDTAKLLMRQKIVGWFQGRSEYGPRALGSRSILCDPRKKEMKDILNEKVKHRENWRPFAASVLREKTHDYFEFTYDESPFMLLVPKVRKEMRERIPALMHVDGTCRIQTVTAKDNGIYYDLIKSFYDNTGMPLILNTSFNLAGEPIVETPIDALKCFLSTQMDYLIMGNYIVRKL